MLSSKNSVWIELTELVKIADEAQEHEDYLNYINQSLSLPSAIKNLALKSIEEIERVINEEKIHTSEYLQYKTNLSTKLQNLSYLIQHSDDIKIINQACTDLAQAAQYNKPLWKHIRKLMIGLTAALFLGWTMGIALPTTLGMKILTGDWVFNNILTTASFMLSIPQGQAAFAVSSLVSNAIGFYPITKLLGWMSTSTPAEEAAKKITLHVNDIKTELSKATESTSTSRENFTRRY